MEETVVLENKEKVMEIFGSFDKNIRKLQSEFNVTIVNRDNMIKISGNESDVLLTKKAIESLYDTLNSEEGLTDQIVNYTIATVRDGVDIASLYGSDCICITSRGKPVKSKTVGQKNYIENIKNNTVTFGIGPAGTGKTYLAVAMAVTSLKKKDVSRIVITRPAVEAGESLGFLPGDLQSKVDPYLRPLHDALYDMLGVEAYQRYVERGVIEVAPLAYMRGRTLDDSYIILDEAQNTTPEQMKMFLTRIGFGSRAIITGDITQVDLPFGKKSGLKEVTRILKNIDDIEFCALSDKDVVRHPLVQAIVKAYERDDRRKAEKENERHSKQSK